MFGITLTRLRSRLRPKAMTDLAELRIFLRDEHIKSGELKENLRKRKMTSHKPPAEPGPSNQPTTTAPPTQTTNADNDLDDDETDAFITETTTPNGSRASLRQIVARLAPRNSSGANDDEIEDAFSVRAGSMLIRDLFDFTNDSWTVISKAVTMRGLEEEMELYDLIDLDAAGEDDEELEEQDGIQGSLLGDGFLASSLNLDS